MDRGDAKTSVRRDFVWWAQQDKQRQRVPWIPLFPGELAFATVVLSTLVVPAMPACVMLRRAISDPEGPLNETWLVLALLAAVTLGFASLDAFTKIRKRANSSTREIAIRG